MYVEAVPNRGSRPAVLLRESIRRGNRVLKRTIANLSDWPTQKVETLRRLLRDEALVCPTDLFSTIRTLPHGHVEIVLGLIRKLGMERLISSTPSRERDLVVALIAARILYPSSKLATSRVFSSCTLAEELGLNVFYGGHYATETFGVRALARDLALRFDVDWSFVDRPSGL